MRRKMEKKMLACILTVSLLLAGCGSKQSETETEKGPITLKAVFVSGELTEDIDKLPMMQKLAEDSNITVEWEIVRSGWDEKKSTMLASGDLPDVIFGAGLTDADITANQEFFVDMSPYIDKYCSNIQNVLKEMPELKAISTFPDGQIYGLPYAGGLRPNSNDCFIINKTWLDKLELEVPETLEEFKEALIAFKTQDPNGNGVADEIPFNFSTETGYEWFGSKILIGAFGKMYDMTDNYIIMNNGTVEYMPVVDEYKKLVSYLHELYSEGLIYNEAFTQDFSKWVSLGHGTDAPVLGSAFGFAIDIMVGNEWADQYVCIKPLAENNKVTPIWGTNYNLVKYDTNHFSITTANKNIEATMRWIDMCYEQEMSLQLYFGSLGTCIEKNDDGSYKILESKDPAVDQDTWNWMNAPKDKGPLAILPSTEEKLTAPEALTARLELGKVYDSYLLEGENIYPLAKYTAEEQEELTVIKADLLSYVQQKYAEWITGGGIENEWDNYITEINNIGLDRYLTICQAAYDRAYK